MAVLAISKVVRDVLSRDITTPADEVIRQAQARGVKAPEKAIRDIVYNVRSELKKKAAKATPVASAARTTPAPAPAPAPAAPVGVPPAPAPAGVTPDLSAIFAAVTRMNAVVAACGGVENARQLLEAVQACGGTVAAGQYLDLVAGMRPGA